MFIKKSPDFTWKQRALSFNSHFNNVSRTITKHLSFKRLRNRTYLNTKTIALKMQQVFAENIKQKISSIIKYVKNYNYK